MNIAYSWFLGLKIHDPVSLHTTISWNRQHRFTDGTIFQNIFDEMFLQAMNHKWLGADCQNIKMIAAHLARIEKLCSHSFD